MRVLVVASMLVLVACGGGSKSGSSAVTPTSSSAAGGLVVKVTHFAPSDTDVQVDIEISNPAASEQRFEWAKFVLTAPDGSTKPAFRDPSDAPYDIVGDQVPLVVDGGARRKK